MSARVTGWLAPMAPGNVLDEFARAASRAKLAEQTERYDEMTSHMKECICCP